MAAFLLPPTAHPAIREAYDYWLAARPVPDRLPGRRNLDPLDIPRLLPHVWLVDVENGDPVVFRYRIVGTAIDRAMERTLAGRRMHEVSPDFYTRPEVCGPYLTLLQSCQPSYRKGLPLFAHNQQYSELERLLMPLATDGNTVDMLFCITLFYLPDGSIIKSNL
jgi:hypothetical protein